MINLFISLTRNPKCIAIPVVISIYIHRDVSCLSKRIGDAEIRDSIVQQVNSEIQKYIPAFQNFKIIKIEVEVVVESYLKIRITDVDTKWIGIVTQWLQLVQGWLYCIATIRKGNPCLRFNLVPQLSLWGKACKIIF